MVFDCVVRSKENDVSFALLPSADDLRNFGPLIAKSLVCLDELHLFVVTPLLFANGRV